MRREEERGRCMERGREGRGGEDRRVVERTGEERDRFRR